MLSFSSLSVIALMLLLDPILAAQVIGNSDIDTRIRQEEMEHSQIMRTMHFLSDIYGPRLTGSPNEKAADEWAMKQMVSWGMKNSHFEPWEFGHPGWTNEMSSGYILSPVRDQLYFKVEAWTPSTKGSIIGQAVIIEPPQNATKQQLTQFLNSVKDEVKGKIVMVGSGSPVPVDLEPVLHRLDDNFVAKLLDPSAQRSEPQPDPTLLTWSQFNREMNAFLIGARALMRVDDAHRPYGEISALSNYTYDTTKALPSVVLRNEDYGRIARILADHIPVPLEFDIRNRSYAAGNGVGRIPVDGHSGNRPQRLRERSRKSECRRGYRALRGLPRRAGEEAADGRALAGGAESFARRRTLKQFSTCRECACTSCRVRFQT